MFDNLRADLGRFRPGTRAVIRGALSLGFAAVLNYRFFHWLHRRGIPGQPLRFFCDRWIHVAAGIDIPHEADFGPGLRIHHFGGIFVHPSVRAGAGCTLYQGATLGDAGDDRGPLLGNDVLVGANALVLGPVRVGDGARIGAGAVVVRDVPSGATVAGNPAREVGRPA